MKIVVAGASGFLGTALHKHLATQDHEVVQLVRSEPTGPGQARWDPDTGRLDPQVLEGAGAVINLAGAAIGRWPWTSSYKQQILDSRLSTTGTIARTIASLTDKPALVNASGAGYYGDRGDERLTEDSGSGATFLAAVARQWEAATEPARDAGARVAIVRTAGVLGRGGGALKYMQIPFQLGVGGRLGDGDQWFATISLTDYVRVVTMLATDPSTEGPYNAVAPEIATNAQFTKAVGERLHRPTVVVVPAIAIKTLLGELSGELLGSIRAEPARLTAAGYEFVHPTVKSQLDAAFS